MKPAAVAAVGLIGSLTLLSCSSDAIAPISFGRFGPLSGDAGRGSFDYTSYARTITEGGDALHAIAAARQVTTAQRQHYGGTGPMTPEAGFPLAPFCPKVPAP